MKKIFIKILILLVSIVSCFCFWQKLAVAAAPTVSSFSPVDNDTYVASSTDLTITFSENIFVDSGNIYIKKTADNSIFETIDVTSAQVSIAGAVATINPSSVLERGVAYYIQIDATCFKNASEEYYAGIGDMTTWEFTVLNDLYVTMLVENIYPGSIGFFSGIQPKFAVMDNYIYFPAANSGSNVELWKSDGTAANTVLVKDIRSGSSGSSPKHLISFDGELYFSAYDDIIGWEPWKSDGTEENTIVLKDVNDGAPNSSINGFKEMGDYLYFSAYNDIVDYELHMTDGTATNTVVVKDINTGGNADVVILTTMNSELYFAATDGSSSLELWKTDGTESGTIMVKDINGSGDGLDSYYTDTMVELEGNLYFAATDGSNGLELWKTDGTATNTVMVKNISVSDSSYPYILAATGDKLYFIATDGSNGFELWKTDGTESGTAIVKDINISAGTGAFDYHDSKTPESVSFKVIGNILYFKADDGINGQELWKTDGTESGTTMVKDINDSGDSLDDNGGRNIDFMEINNELYFFADDGIHGGELWRSDGTAAGTAMVTDIRVGFNGSTANNFTVMNGELYFAAADLSYGMELRRTYIITVPTVLSNASVSVSLATATISGEIQSIGKQNNTERGFVWSSVTASPTVNDDKTSQTGLFDVGSFSATISDLNCATTYYFRAYSVNRAGTSYGDSVSFTTEACPPSLPPDAHKPPKKPKKDKDGEEIEGDFKIIINNGERKTKERTVSLELIAGSDTVDMAISEDPEFTYASIEPYQENKEYVLSEGEGQKTIYVKFYTKWGQASEAVSDSIVYKEVSGIDKEESGEETKKESFFDIPKFLGGVIFQTGDRDKIWYVNPADQKKYSVENPFMMFNVMRYLSLGAVHEYINKYLEFPQRVLGRILLDVEKNGEAYYINPIDKKKYYLGRPDDAFNIMKGFSTGISNSDIEKIETGEVKINK